MSDASSIASCRAKLAELDAEIRRLPVESIHRLNAVLGLIPTLDSRLQSEIALHVREGLPPAPPLAPDQTTSAPVTGERPRMIGEDIDPWEVHIARHGIT
jgi:hypothetical protein